MFHLLPLYVFISVQNTDRIRKLRATFAPPSACIFINGMETDFLSYRI